MTGAARSETAPRGRFAYWLEPRGPIPKAALAAHARYVATLDATGALVVGGDFADGGGMVCVYADGAAEAQAIAAADPLVAFGYALACVRELLSPMP